MSLIKNITDATLESINGLSPLQQQIVLMWCHDITITSKDPNEADELVKRSNKSDKTIRNHRDSAFATLRKRLEDKGEIIMKNQHISREDVLRTSQ
ncbi:hypothetical protein [Acinetobacter seifertii]|uniref:hypothetical protein n=1 Tax=Acinetobacter seifertii TaxID=1530123 RepID=UPI003F725ED9